MRLIVTRPAAQAAGWVQALQALGQPAAALPLIDITGPEDPVPLQAAWAGLGGLALVMFVSANAVQHFFAHAPAGSAWPTGLRAACTGPGTASALRTAGVPASGVVQPAEEAASFDSEALWALLAGEPWAGRRVLVVRGEQGRNWLADTLRAAGAEVGFVVAYRRHCPVPDAAGQALLAAARADPAAHLWVFSSSEAVGHLRSLAPQADWSQALALASHPRIAQAAQGLGFGQVQLVAVPTPAAVAEAARALQASLAQGRR
ncbi:uroporphyrinogen-III synthase [beta proteobacterium AAP51]|nr:uroporphyrinogen-III synthase [beta proteobacterium AAP51]